MDLIYKGAALTRRCEVAKLVIKRLNTELGLDKEQIVKWLNYNSKVDFSPKQYIDAGLEYIVFERIDREVLDKK